MSVKVLGSQTVSAHPSMICKFPFDLCCDCLRTGGYVTDRPTVLWSVMNSENLPNNARGYDLIRINPLQPGTASSKSPARAMEPHWAPSALGKLGDVDTWAHNPRG
jgi:hypothetical protein